jgi:AcrR family transcriptional regulator
VYAEKGFLAATIEDIAAAARVSVGAIYLCFKSKEDLYVSLLGEVMEMFTRELTGILRSSVRPDQKLRAAWDLFLRFQKESSESHRVFFLFHDPRFPSAIPPDTLPALNRTAGRNCVLAPQIVREGMEAGIYRKGNPREVVDVLWSVFLGLVHLSETRANLRLHLTTLEQLHRRAFEWLEGGLRRSDGARQ